MTKLLISLVFVLASTLIISNADEAQKVETPGRKIYIIDQSHPVDPNDVPKDEPLQTAQEVKKEVPMIKVAPAETNDKTQVVEDQTAKLDPIPLILPKFPLLNFNPPFFFGNSDQDQSPVNSEDSSRPKGFLNILLMKSIKNSEENSDESSLNQPIKSSFVIFKLFPKNDQDDESDKSLLGGDSDVDNKRVHLLGGLGDNDPDMIRFKQDNKLVMTGDEDSQINSFKLGDDEEHKFFITTMIERVKNLFNTINNEGNELVRQAPFIIRTDDGSSAVIPNDIGADVENHRSQSLNKCMMLNFMRLKASIYYRTILHLLFFTGVLLFILSMVMITFKTFRKRRFSTIRYHPHNMTVSCIDGDLETKKSKFGNFRPWSGIRTDKSSLIGGGECKKILIQAPPAYDQVIIDDKTSALTKNTIYIGLTDENEKPNEPDTKSLPPEYEETSNKSNQA